ncbi:MAG: hypothetical protein AMXMBFR33_06320 [Candidatus Xenobia bacterium]
MLETSVGIRSILLLDSEGPGPEQIPCVSEPHPEVDVAVVSLAELERYLQLKPRLGRIPCFVVVGEESVGPALRAGLTEFVARPVDWPALLDRIAAHRHQLSVHAFHQAIHDVARFLHHAEALTAAPAYRELERQIVNAAAMAASADGGWLFGVDSGGQLTALEAVGYPLPVPEDLRASRGLVHDAFKSRLEKCVGLAGDEDPTGLTPFERGKSSLLAVPLMNHGRCLGVLEVAREGGRPTFRPEQVSLMVQLGRLAAAVLAAHRHEERFSSLLVRALNRVLAVQEEGRGKPTAEVTAAFERVTHQARSSDLAEREMMDLVHNLQALKALGGHHLGFWRSTLERYLAEVARP